MELSDKYTELIIDGWIYLNDEIILEQMTNETNKDSIPHFYKRVLRTNNYIEEVDYKKISKDDELVKIYENSNLYISKINQITSNRKLYYACTQNLLNKLLLQIKHKRHIIKSVIIESRISDKLAQEIQGEREFTIPNTHLRIDIKTTTQIIEVKRFRVKTTAIGQLLYYGTYYPDKSLRIHLFECDSKRDLIFEKICKNINIEVTYED